MGTKEFFSKGWPTRIGFYLGKYSPPRGGRFLAGIAARALMTLKPDIYHALRDNLRHICPEASEAELRAMMYRIFAQAARSYYELFHNIGRGRVQVKDFQPPVIVDPQMAAYIQEALATGRGLFILCAHISNFDLGGISLSQFMDIPLQVLSVSDPAPGFEIFNALREQAGALMTPIGPRALREAMLRLEAGGAVITGVDRPVREGNEPVEFFGAVAQLPTGYIRIPLRTNCWVMTATSYYEDGIYRVVSNPPFEMERTGDKEQDIQVNLRRVLAQIEGLIRRHPDQWMMFLPVWPGDKAGERVNK